MMSRHRLWIALAGLLLVGLGPSSARADRVLASPEFAPGSGLEMRVTSFYEQLPPYGFLPVRVEVKNHSPATRTWDFEAADLQNGGVRTAKFATALRVEANTEKSFDILVPLQPQFESYRRYSNLTVVISGPGISAGRAGTLGSGGGGAAPTPFVGMGEALSVKHWGSIRDNLEKKHSRSLEGTALNLDLLPDDWRGFAGFSIILFTDEEWRRITPGSRNALQDWIAQGGKLILCATGEAADLPPAGAVGSGEIELWRLPEGSTQGEEFVRRATQLLDSAEDKSPIAANLISYSQPWKLAELVGRAEPPQALIIGFVLVFGLIIGPFNFLVFAPVGNRHRLFWTTPLISVVASLLLATFIMLSEGFGGQGRRFEAVLSLPALHKEVLWQEQVSRTGILVGNSFTPSEPCLLLPLPLKGARARAETGNIFSLNGQVWSGDWFRNRSTQGQLLAAVTPARGRLEISRDTTGAPLAVSSFEKVLERCWYLDEEGRVWGGESLAPGEKKPLKKLSKTDYDRAWDEALKSAGPAIRAAAEEFADGAVTGRFFATTSAPQPISTLPSIHWQDAGGLIFGLPAQ